MRASCNNFWVKTPDSQLRAPPVYRLQSLRRATFFSIYCSNCESLLPFL